MKTINWIQLILLVGLILLGIFASLYDKTKLDECSKDWDAIIIDKNRRKSRGYFIKYKYLINGKEFTSSESIKKKIEITSFNIGDTILIDISCSDPNVSKFKKLE